MKHVVSLVSGFGWHVQDLARAAKVVGVRFDAIPFPKVVGRVETGVGRVEASGVDLGSVDGVLVRMMPPGSLEQVIFRMDALHRLEAKGVPVLNPPRAVEAAVDKYLALAMLEAGGLPVPEDLGGRVGRRSPPGLRGARRRRGGQAAVRLGGPGARPRLRPGPGLADLSHAGASGLRALRSVARQAIPDTTSGPSSWAAKSWARSADSPPTENGGRTWPSAVAPRPCQLEPEAERLALRSARAVGAVMAGVDLLPDLENGGWTVLEVNAVPGWKALARRDGGRRCRRDPGPSPGPRPMTPDSPMIGPGQLAQLACLLEATARKPGNVHRFRDFDDAHYLDFVLSASAIAGPLDLAPDCHARHDPFSDPSRRRGGWSRRTPTWA